MVVFPAAGLGSRSTRVIERRGQHCRGFPERKQKETLLQWQNPRRICNIRRNRRRIADVRIHSKFEELSQIIVSLESIAAIAARWKLSAVARLVCFRLPPHSHSRRMTSGG